MTSIVNTSAGTALSSFAYNYNTAGLLTSENDNGSLQTYTYDATNQLLTDARPGGTQTLTYDANGNRNNGSYTVGTGNQMSSDGTYNYSYDNEGNLVTKTRISDGDYWTYGYDNLNEMTSAVEKTSGGTTEVSATYEYGPFQERLEKDVTNGATVTTKFGYDGWKTDLNAFGNPATYVGHENWDVWADLSGSNTLQTRYLRGNLVDQVFARLDSSNYFLLTDHLGSIVTVVDTSGNVKDQVSYDGWGNATQTNSSYGGRYLWTGRETDVETGLQYNRQRYYDPGTGRWISQDPLGLGAGDSNLYRYVIGSPASATDPSGLIAWGFSSRPRSIDASVTMFVSVRFKWVDTKTSKWTVAREKAFEGAYKTSVESIWNHRYWTKNIYIMSPNDYIERSSDGCHLEREWVPVLKISVLDGEEADYVMSVTSNPTGRFIRSNATVGPQPGTGESVANLDEDDVNGNTAAHEFGHTLGLQHPGQYLPPDRRPPRNSDADYDADSSSLMGRGSGLRLPYFAKWVAALNEHFSDKRPYAAAWISYRWGGNVISYSD